MIRFEPAPRRLGVPRFAAVIVLVWATLVVCAYALSNATGVDASPCLFKNATGVPCATCGGTRATMSLARADVAGALAFNPLVVVALTIGAAWLIVRLGFARRVRVDLNPRARTAAWSLLAAAFVANWLYVISMGN